MLSFYLYISSPVNDNEVYPMMRHHNLGMSTELDRLTIDNVDNGMWTKIDIGLGRHHDSFQIVFDVAHNSESYNAGIAIDEISFFDCAIKPPQDECMSDEFHCANKACVFINEQCDFSDDCGDESDETLVECGDYLRVNFEDLENPFGFFRQDDETTDFKFTIGNGTTINKHTGPPFDHTTFDPEGHYAFVASEKYDAHSRAVLSTPLLQPSDNSCRVRFFVHLHGPGVGTLILYHQDQLGDLTKVWESMPEGGEHVDVNAWQRVSSELAVDHEYRIVIEATVGRVGEGDIGLDDFSLTPGCKWAEAPPTETTPEHTTEPHTTPKMTTDHATTTEKRTTTEHFTTKSTTREHFTTTYVAPISTATAAPFDPNNQAVMIIAIVAGVLIVLIIGIVTVYAVRTRRIRIPGMNRLATMVNPNYQRMDDSNMVSLRDLSPKED